MTDWHSSIFAEDVEKERRKAELDRIRFEEKQKKYRDVFGTKDGREVLDDILDECHVFHTTFTGSSKTYFLEGKRALGLFLMAMVGLNGTVAELEAIKAKRLDEELNDE